MRCGDLARELASPTGAFSRAEVDAHVAACPACAGRSRLASKFDRIWLETRPTDRPADALDALWARASAAIDAREVPSTIPFDRKVRRRWAVSVLVVAQAAALLVAALVLFRHQAARPIELADATNPKVEAGPDLLSLDVGPDEVLVVRIGDGKSHRVEMVSQSDLFDHPSLPPLTPHDEMNDMETAGWSPWGTVAAQ